MFLKTAQKKDININIFEKKNRSFWNFFISETKGSFSENEKFLENKVLEFIDEYRETFDSLAKK